MQELKSTYGLIGYPVKHSLSPCMHNTAFKALGINAAYKLFPLKEGELAPFFEDLKVESSPIFGLNVTVPYKEKVIQHMDGLSPFAKKTMAVNTVVVQKGRKFIGYNTDGPGFLAHLSELGFDAGKKRIAMLGAGGAARAIISVLCLIPECPESILIYDIDKEKADGLIKDFKTRFDVSVVQPVNSVDDLNIEISDLLINATPIGMKNSDLCLIEPELFHSNMLVYDLIYNPEETALLKLAKDRGAQTANGLGMLFFQGVLAFQHWANIELDQNIKDKMRKSLNMRKAL